MGLGGSYSAESLGDRFDNFYKIITRLDQQCQTGYLPSDFRSTLKQLNQEEEDLNNDYIQLTTLESVFKDAQKQLDLLNKKIPSDTIDKKITVKAEKISDATSDFLCKYVVPKIVDLAASGFRNFPFVVAAGALHFWQGSWVSIPFLGAAVIYKGAANGLYSQTSHLCSLINKSVTNMNSTVGIWNAMALLAMGHQYFANGTIHTAAVGVSYLAFRTFLGNRINRYMQLKNWSWTLFPTTKAYVKAERTLVSGAKTVKDAIKRKFFSSNTIVNPALRKEILRLDEKGIDRADHPTILYSIMLKENPILDFPLEIKLREKTIFLDQEDMIELCELVMPFQEFRDLYNNSHIGPISESKKRTDIRINRLISFLNDNDEREKAEAFIRLLNNREIPRDSRNNNRASTSRNRRKRRSDEGVGAFPRAPGPDHASSESESSYAVLGRSAYQEGVVSPGIKDEPVAASHREDIAGAADSFPPQSEGDLEGDLSDESSYHHVRRLSEPSKADVPSSSHRIPRRASVLGVINPVVVESPAAGEPALQRQELITPMPIRGTGTHALNMEREVLSSSDDKDGLDYSLHKGFVVDRSRSSSPVQSPQFVGKSSGTVLAQTGSAESPPEELHLDSDGISRSYIMPVDPEAISHSYVMADSAAAASPPLSSDIMPRDRSPSTDLEIHPDTRFKGKHEAPPEKPKVNPSDLEQEKKDTELATQESIVSAIFTAIEGIRTGKKFYFSRKDIAIFGTEHGGSAKRTVYSVFNGIKGLVTDDVYDRDLDGLISRIDYLEKFFQNYPSKKGELLSNTRIAIAALDELKENYEEKSMQEDILTSSIRRLMKMKPIS